MWKGKNWVGKEWEGQKLRTPEKKKNEEWYKRPPAYLLKELQRLMKEHWRIPTFWLKWGFSLPVEDFLVTVHTRQFCFFISVSFLNFSSLPRSSFFQICCDLQMHTFYFFLFSYFLHFPNPNLLLHAIPSTRNLRLYNFRHTWKWIFALWQHWCVFLHTELS